MIARRPHTGRVALVLTTILVLGGVLRLIGLSFGLPAVYNPDEVSIMNRALALGQNGLNPGNFLYPSLYFYVLFAWEGAWFLLGRALGVFASLADFERAFFVNPSSIYLAGRALSVVCGVATVWATWRLGARLFGPRAGLAAALLLAVAPLAVRDAHYVKHDVPVTLLVVLAHVLAASTLDGASRRVRWVAASVVAGLAISTHYYAIFVLLPIAWLAGAPGRGETGRDHLSRGLWVCVVAAATFMATSPFLVLNMDTAIRDIVANRQIVMDRATSSAGAFGSLAFYLSWLGRDGVGLVAACLAAIGIPVAIAAGWRHAALTLAFPVTFVLFLANTYPASRYLNPVLPFVAVLAGAAVSWLSNGGRLRQSIAWSLLGLAAVQAGAASARTDVFFGQTDTRTLALGWIEQHAAEGTTILVQPYSVPLSLSRTALVEALTTHLGSPSRASVKFQRQLALDPYPTPAYRVLYLGVGGLDVDKIYVDPATFDADRRLETLKKAGVTYIVLKRYNVPDPAMASLVSALEQEKRPEVVFSPYKAVSATGDVAHVAPFLHNSDTRIDPALSRPGPIVEIWKLD